MKKIIFICCCFVILITSPAFVGTWTETQNRPQEFDENERIVRITSDISTTSESLIDATGLSFSILANKDYIFEVSLIYTTGATNRGITLAVNGPASHMAIVGECMVSIAGGCRR
ncbi:MAG: hypothetical protein V1833_03690 [Elusimicrobiota bacterium]